MAAPIIWVVDTSSVSQALTQKVQPTLPGGKIRTYYIAAVEVEWNYAPANMDLMTGKPFESESKIWAEHGKDRISRDSEGTPYADTSLAGAGLVPPGQTHTYIWSVPERAGPGENDGSAVVWLYHSHNWEPNDVNAGLLGPMVITRRGMARADGSPKDVDREFATLFMLIDENQSHYLQRNIDAYTEEPKSVNRREFVLSDVDGNFHGAGIGFAAANFRASINGYMFSNLPMLVMRRGEHVRWYVVTLGGAVNIHTPHWHGNVISIGGHHTDIFSLLPAQFVTADMVPDNVGMWMFHCHVDEHMEAGMTAMYEVVP